MNHRGLALSLLAGPIVWGVTAPLGAQVKERQLSEPDAAFAEPFSLIQGLRELPDGRVMIADPLEQTLAIIDLESGALEPLGNVGPGPEEFRQPDGLFPLPGEATLLVDLGNARLTTLGPDGSFGETMPITQGEPGRGGGLLMILPRGTDSDGRLYFQPFGGRRPGAELPDSGAIVRLTRGSGAIDTIVMIKRPEMKRSTSSGGNDRSVSIQPVPLSSEDGWAVGWDGRIAVARSSEYHLEWIGPDGTVTSGARVSYEPVKIRQADKEEWAERLEGGLMVGMTIDNGERRVTFRRGAGGAASIDLESLDWPQTKPAFQANRIWVTPEGDAWVQRYVAAGEPPVIDVFGEDGNLKARIRLPDGRRVVGFGQGTVYLIQVDEDGLQWLERYRRTT